MEYILDRLEIRGFTFWENVQGRGTYKGEPRRGTHTWPEMNTAIMTIVEDNQVEGLLHAVQQLNSINEEVGIRAFVWNVEQTV